MTRAVRHETCVCGGIISARSMREAASSVLRHNMSLTHSVWRLGREGPTAFDLTRDLSGWRSRASVPLVRRVS